MDIEPSSYEELILHSSKTLDDRLRKVEKDLASLKGIVFRNMKVKKMTEDLTTASGGKYV